MMLPQSRQVDSPKSRWSQLVRETRSSLGETQGEFAARFELASQSVQQWESQATMPRTDNLARMAQIIGRTTDELNEYLKTGEWIGTDEFNLSRTLTHLRSQEPKILIKVMAEISSILESQLAS